MHMVLMPPGVHAALNTTGEKEPDSKNLSGYKEFLSSSGIDYSARTTILK